MEARDQGIKELLIQLPANAGLDVNIAVVVFLAGATVSSALAAAYSFDRIRK